MSIQLITFYPLLFISVFQTNTTKIDLNIEKTQTGLIGGDKKVIFDIILFTLWGHH